jgi:hypothetical protein
LHGSAVGGGSGWNGVLAPHGKGTGPEGHQQT